MTERLPKAVLLDLDDTILAFSEGADPCWRSICQRFAPRIEGLAPEKLFAAIKEGRAWFWGHPKRHRRGRLHPDQARREIVARAFSRLSIDAPRLANEIADTYTLEREDTIRPFPGAIKALRHLRDQGVRLALITCGNAEVQRGKIDRFGLAPLFDCILIEGEFGPGKPDERVYQHALDQLGVEAEETWMVGDNLEWDVQAPQKLGILGIWLDFAGSGLPETSPVRPGRVVRSLAELVQASDDAWPANHEASG
jgi:putative hydrolase of the HAD superfamily